MSGSNEKFHVLGIGNAIVDILAHAGDDFLAAHGLEKGATTLIDENRAGTLYEAMGPAVECSGGSAANTIASLAGLGASTAFVGKVRDDLFGDIFRHDIKALGVSFDTRSSHAGAPTARCMVFVTPDAERTMQTHLGACVELGPEDIDVETVSEARVTYLESYLWDPPRAKEAFLKAADIAHSLDKQVSLSLSDPFCVDRHREDFLDLIRDHVDILFANEEELKGLYQTDALDDAVAAVNGHCAIAAVTLGEQGSIIVSEDQVIEIKAEKVDQVKDTTGAGDGFAAGFLFGLTKGFGLETSGRLGSVVAAEIISHMGARSDADLKALVNKSIPNLNI